MNKLLRTNSVSVFFSWPWPAVIEKYWGVFKLLNTTVKHWLQYLHFWGEKTLPWASDWKTTVWVDMSLCGCTLWPLMFRLNVLLCTVYSSGSQSEGQAPPGHSTIFGTDSLNQFATVEEMHWFVCFVGIHIVQWRFEGLFWALRRRCVFECTVVKPLVNKAAVCHLHMSLLRSKRVVQHSFTQVSGWKESCNMQMTQSTLHTHVLMS